MLIKIDDHIKVRVSIEDTSKPAEERNITQKGVNIASMIAYDAANYCRNRGEKGLEVKYRKYWAALYAALEKAGYYDGVADHDVE